MADDAAAAVVESDGVDLSQEQLDAVGESGNLSMGAGATALGEHLDKPVRLAPPQVTALAQDGQLPEITGPCVRVDLVYSGAVSGTSIVIVGAHDAAVVAELMAGRDGSEAPDTLDDDRLASWREALSKVAEAAGPSISVAVGADVNIQVGEAAVLDGPPPVSELAAALGGGDSCIALVFKFTVGDLVDGKLVQIMPVEMARNASDVLLGAVPDAGSGPGKAQFESLRPEAGAAPQAGIEMLLDIDLPVTVELGRTQMQIRDILRLGPGSVVELDKLAGEPVDVVVNGKQVAAGEVVVIDENFGVRITSVVSAEDRIRNLR